MIVKNKSLQKSLWVLLIWILPSQYLHICSFYCTKSTTTFASNTQGATQGGSPNNPDVGTQGFAGGNTTIATLNPNYTSAAPIIK